MTKYFYNKIKKKSPNLKFEDLYFIYTYIIY